MLSILSIPVLYAGESENQNANCSKDVAKFCISKDGKNAAQLTVEAMSNCLEKNKNQLTDGCQKILAQKSNNKCMQSLVEKCASLEGDKHIHCLAESQLSDSNTCNKK